MSSGQGAREIDEAPAPVVRAPVAGAPRPTEKEVLASLVDELTRLGWHVTLSSDGVSVHESDRAGKPMRMASAFIARNSNAPEGSRGFRQRRPWTVMVLRIAKARTYVSLDTALEFFMMQARVNAPTLRPRPGRHEHGSSPLP